MDNKYDQYPPPQGPPPPYNQTPPPMGFQPNTQVVYPPPASPHHSTTVVTAQPMVATPPMLVVAGGNCPACRSGILQNEFTCCGICLGICFFPLGIICCLLMRERKCTNCRGSFGSA